MTTTKKPNLERRARTRHRTALDVSLQLGTQSTTVSTRDVCLSGLSCYLPEPLELFKKYRFRLFVPTREAKEEIDGEGIVVRVEEVEVGDCNLFQTAFFFQHLDAGHVRILEQFMENEARETD